MMKVAASLLASFIVAGCASKSANVEATYVPAQNYGGYTCQQLAEEGRNVSARAAQAAGQQDKNRKNDTMKTTVGVILFWPIILANEGNGQVTAELANLKGQMKAIEQTSTKKNCGIRFQQS